MNKTAYLLLLPLLCAAAGPVAGQSKGTPFNGLILDGTGKGVKARIEVKHNEGKYTLSNRQGKFGLTDIAATDTLVITRRRVRAEIPVEGRKSVRVTWVEGDRIAFDEDEELIDSGFGYIKRREYTSSSANLSGEEMIRRGFTDLQTAVVSLVPGLTLVNGQIIIRGVGSVNSDNGALIVCDGIPVSNINAINIRDVKSVEVQKGSNMYGMRGANGVIIIRTRDR